MVHQYKEGKAKDMPRLRTNTLHTLKLLDSVFVKEDPSYDHKASFRSLLTIQWRKEHAKLGVQSREDYIVNEKLSANRTLAEKEIAKANLSG